MTKHCTRFITLTAVAFGLAGACSSGGLPATVPSFDPANFSNPSEVTNPWLGFEAGFTNIYTEATEDGLEVIVVETLPDTRMVAGIESRVVRDRVFLEELLIEDTHDWYAQDDDGNVWYMGEEVDNYEYDDDDNLLEITHEGAWEANKDVAGLGVVGYAGYYMLANPAVGTKYHQEYYEGEAEDMASIEGIEVTVELADGSTWTTLQTNEWAPLESGPEDGALTHFAAGVGNVMDEPMEGGPRLELIGRFDTTPASLPDFEAASFTTPTAIDNSYWPMKVGTKWTYQTETDEGLEVIVVEVLAATRIVDGVECAVVRDTVKIGGVLIEDTHDWYAQDDAGNIWYMGEEVDNYNYDDNGELIDITHEGAWEAGLDVKNRGFIAKPGIVMPATSTARRSYRQEYYKGEAEDMAMTVRMDAEVTVTSGSYTDVLQTLDWVPLDAAAVEYKYFAPGVGLILESVPGTDERVELVSFEPAH